MTLDPRALPRLLAGVGEHPMSSLTAHLEIHGPLRELSGEQILSAVETSGLRGRGGASFPTARKMRAVAGRRGSKFVVANGTEGEPISKKDRVLLREVPHLVLDGVAMAARAVGASRALLAVSAADQRGAAALSRALEERRDRAVEIVRTPERYLAGQETALVDLLNGGPGLPGFGVRPFERGVEGRPTLVQNVETFAHIGLIARHGGQWFRALGTPGDPGSALMTVGGGVSAPGVYEIAHGMGLAELLDHVGAEPGAAVLIGGYFGTWVPANAVSQLRLAGDELRGFGASLGAGVLMVLPRSACPVAEAARVSEYFEAQSAGQCGPCVNGLAAMAFTVGAVAAGTAGRGDLGDLERWTRELPGRGACAHPDGASRFLASAIRVFAEEFHDHARHGACERCSGAPVLPTPLPMPMAA
ncbi:MAG TPA: NADH-ubiquinone oxidoreductase-F iron-sulfur binding region domain-containing protein [Solirubrobacteraceae bacterium]|nr:NADH-ubiquinone oxidoreductase-F iron-sulfur binding region domain-containing protein [Solirubrobacteraceae bacterium]